MSEWALKRFWREVSVVEEDGGFAVRLDNRPVKTPAKRALVLPTRAVADNVALEWEAQVEKVNPTTMPWTRSANAAIDKVATQRAEVAAHLADYAGSDLLCYRAEGPGGLVVRQTRAWDALLDWAEETYGARLAVTHGVMPIEQKPSQVATLGRAMEDMTDFQLTGFHDLVTLSGSYVIGLAAANDHLAALDLWAMSRLDEDWQIEQWGEDEEASAHAALKRDAFLHAREVYHAS